MCKIQANFTRNNRTAIWIKAGRFSDLDSVFVGNTGASLCFFGAETVSSLNHSLFQGNHRQETIRAICRGTKCADFVAEL